MALYKDPDWLHEAHSEYMLTTYEMAEEAGCCQWTIRHWMNRLDISLRTQSEAVRLRFEDVRERENISRKVLELWKDEGYRKRQLIGRLRGWENEDRRREMSRRSSLQVGDRHPNWRGGCSEYPEEFSREFKCEIRGRDGFRCVICGVTENGKAHNVHHVNYVKNDTVLENCITLCKHCHTRTNFERDFWQEKLMLIMVGIKRIPIT